MTGFLCRTLAALCLACAAFADDGPSSRVSITSQPAGATVIVDGRDRGTTPLTLFDLAPGRHHLKYRLAGYVECNRFFTTEEGPFLEKNEVLVEEKGLLLLQSDPVGCAITIDGVAAGQTPRLVTDLSAKDQHTVKLVKPGYQPMTLAVKFNGREPVVRTETLVPDSGAINILTEPEGAEVLVNGVSRGESPVLVRDVPKGRAVIKCRLDGFKEEVRELSVRAGDQQTLSLALEALPGTLHLVSDPEGARFYVNGEARGVGPLAISGLAAGEYEVRVEKQGFGTETRKVVIERGQSAREEFKLSNVMGRIEVRTCPGGATVVLDGRILGVTKESAGNEPSDVFPIENILEGEHTLIIRKEGYQESLRHPKVVNSKTARANIRLKRVFTPDVEIETIRGTYRGVLVSNTAEGLVMEVSLGITSTFPRAEIRKVTFLDKPTGGKGAEPAKDEKAK